MLAVCAASIERLGGRALRLGGDEGENPDVLLGLIDALVCCDDGGGDRTAIELVRAALDDDMPVYALGEGMHLLNRAFGGKPAEAVFEHSGDGEDGESAYHHIYIAPGSRLAAVVGSGGFVRVNSRHEKGLKGGAEVALAAGIGVFTGGWDDRGAGKQSPSLGHRCAIQTGAQDGSPAAL